MARHNFYILEHPLPQRFIPTLKNDPATMRNDHWTALLLLLLASSSSSFLLGSTTAFSSAEEADGIVVVPSASCCLCEDCVEPVVGSASVDFVTGDVACADLHERLLLLAPFTNNDQQCNVYIRAHRENCCGTSRRSDQDSSVSSTALIRTLQYGLDHPKCELCTNGNVPGSCGRAIGAKPCSFVRSFF
jgi:hypothetical protein